MRGLLDYDGKPWNSPVAASYFSNLFIVLRR